MLQINSSRLSIGPAVVTFTVYAIFMDRIFCIYVGGIHNTHLRGACGPVALHAPPQSGCYPISNDMGFYVISESHPRFPVIFAYPGEHV